MSTLMKRLFLCIIGIIAGIASWPFAEASLVWQNSFPSYLAFSVFLGVIFGLFMGSFFAANEGIISSNRSKIFSGMLTGAVVGILGGITGFLTGQAVLFILGNYFLLSPSDFNNIGLPVSRAIGWAILGIFIGCTEGVRSRSMKKIIVGIIGGFIGGLLGGFILEYSKVYISNIILARFIGLTVFGFCIGLFYGFVEKSISKGVLRLLNGKFKGKEYLVNQNRMKIGSANRNDIVLNDYQNVENVHANLFVKNNEVFIKNISKDKPVRVNDDIVQEHMLKMEDVIKIGEAKFMYKYH
jgi:hypothetical protein